MIPGIDKDRMPGKSVVEDRAEVERTTSSVYDDAMDFPSAVILWSKPGYSTTVGMKISGYTRRS